jgi:asparagine synthase (glutamine-hydrolysing)
MVYKLAKEKDIIVLLDGQGADEVLGGYKKYTNWFLQEILRNNLSLFKKEKALLFANDFLESWNYKNYFAAFLPKFTSQQLQSRAIHQQNINEFINKDFLHQFQNTATLQKPIVKNLQDILNYSTNIFGLSDLLRYADRNAMANSREVRLPFLNRDLVNFTVALPSIYKIKDGYTKWILREIVKEKLPQEIVWRKGKIGYEPPQKLWMQNIEVQEMIKAARKKLVNYHILNPSILNYKPITAAAHDANNFDWWILCATQLIA